MRLRATYSAAFGLILTFFMVTTVTGIGPYSTQFGSYWAFGLLMAVGTLLVLRPAEVIGITVRPASLLGVLFFSFLVGAALFTSEGRELRLAKPMLAQLACFLLALWVAPRFLGRRQFAFAILLAYIIAVGSNFLEFFISPQLWSESPGRAAGFFVNPNNSGDEIALLTFLVLSCWRSMPWPWVIALLLSGLVAVVVTFSRGSIIIFSILMLAFFLHRIWERGGLRLRHCLALTVIVSFGTWLVNKLMNSGLSSGASMRLMSLIDLNFSDSSVKTRSNALLHFIALFISHPLFGARPFGVLMAKNGDGPHNSFIALGADFGVLALCVPLLMIFLAIRGAKRLDWRGSLAITLLGLASWMFFSSMFSHNVFYSSYGAVASGLAMGGLNIRTRASQYMSQGGV